MGGGKMNLVVAGSGQTVRAKGKVTSVKTSKKKDSLVAKVNDLENRLQSEKFRKTMSGLALTVGQVYFNGSGYYSSDITPIVSVGDGYNGRTGAKIRLHSSYLQFQFFLILLVSSFLHLVFV